MGKAKKMKCNVCGYEWLHYNGRGLLGNETTNNRTENAIKENLKNACKCPKCKSTDIGTYDDIHILWD